MLDINDTKKQIKKYLIMSGVFSIFGFIYEQLSHNIYSQYMIYAFLFPLLMGAMIYGIIYKTETGELLSKLGMNIYNSAILTFTLGSVMQGVLEIYGTTNKLVFYYLIIGTILVIISLIINIIQTINNMRN